MRQQARSARRAAAAALLAAFLVPAAHAARPVLVHGPGTWTLPRLGAGGTVFREQVSRPRQQLVARYRLPAGVRQGHGTWYLLRLHVAVAFRPRATPGTLEVFGRVNGLTVASIVYDVENAGGRTRVVSDSVGLVSGHVREAGRSLVREQVFENYLGYRDVRRGESSLALGFRQDAFPMLRSVRIYPDSGLEIMPYPPPQPRLSVRIPEQAIRVGHTFHLVYEIRNASGGPIPRAEVALVRSGGFASDGPRSVVVRWDAATRSLHGAFVLRPQTTGRIPLALEATASLRSVRAVTAVAVRPAESGELAVAVAVAVAVGAGVLATMALVLLRRERR